MNETLKRALSGAVYVVLLIGCISYSREGLAVLFGAFLVIGAKPSEHTDGRDFYRNPAYYTYDFTKGEVGPRHIVASFNDADVNRELAILYCQKFDVIIFDFSTDKYRNGNPAIIDFLLTMLKPGGSFITEFETGGIDLSGLVGRTNGSSPEDFLKKLHKEIMYISRFQKKIEKARVELSLQKNILFAGMSQKFIFLLFQN